MCCKAVVWTDGLGTLVSGPSSTLSGDVVADPTLGWRARLRFRRMETVTVKAHASLQGLRAGEVGTIERTAEVDALIANGRLTVVGEPAPEPKRSKAKVDPAPEPTPEIDEAPPVDEA